MASYQGHLVTSTALGAAYGVAAAWHWRLDWGPACLAGGLTSLGGLLPDLDSDSGVPVRELFGLLAAAGTFLVVGRLASTRFTPEQILVILAGIYLFIRYGLASYFKHATVHRGMFHSIPAMLIAGFAVYLVYDAAEWLRWYLAGGLMLGFLSHLVLDELCSVNLNGGLVRVNRMAGSALKLASPSWKATAFTYLVLLTLGGLVFLRSDFPVRR